MNEQDLQQGIIPEAGTQQTTPTYSAAQNNQQVAPSYSADQTQQYGAAGTQSTSAAFGTDQTQQYGAVGTQSTSAAFGTEAAQQYGAAGMQSTSAAYGMNQNGFGQQNVQQPNAQQISQQAASASNNYFDNVDMRGQETAYNAGRNAGQNGNSWNNDNRNSDSWNGGTWNDNGSTATENSGKKKSRKAPKEKKPMGFLGRAICAALLAVIFGGVAGGTFYGVCYYTGVWEKNAQVTEAVPQLLPTAEHSGKGEVALENNEIKQARTETTQVVSSDISQVVEEVIPAMVTIVNTADVTTYDFWGRTYTQEQQGSGTGIIIGENDSELLIVTNHHVVTDAKKLEITFNDGATAVAKIKGMDSEMDLAVVAVPLSDISEETKKAIVAARMGDSENLKLGQPVIVIGNALGIGISVTDGIISGLNREMTSEDGQKGTFIQTNAEVNHGNSGGALLNIKGEVIGIVSSKIDGYSVEGMGYAIPISAANPIISDLRERQTKGDKVPAEEQGYMGVNLLDVTEDAKFYYNMPDGVYIYDVFEDGVADQAGLRKGDVITAIEGERVKSIAELKKTLQYYRVGDSIKVTYSRMENSEYESHDVTLKLGKKQ